MPWTDERLITFTQRSESTRIWHESRVSARGRSLAPSRSCSAGPMGGASPPRISTRQVVHRRVAAAAVHDVDTLILDGQHQLLARVNLK